ncbi:hypothetical protein AVEN_101933-1 [Araneus ventricosus]|uniref:DUF7041 domain-containing protein n=1 Tax=Araneus ventricosus TaxID=182803 RepID=A0A4Y2D8T0_ARAVE|nr:hypothetical protein AVEN_101933-1 [Araneus ventricosus]
MTTLDDGCSDSAIYTARSSLWFHMLESTFERLLPKPITESRRNNYVVAHSTRNCYSGTRRSIQPGSSVHVRRSKIKIIDRCSESKTREIRASVGR